jgi:glutathione S-transferase
MITVHGASGSPFVRKVLAVLAIKNVPYEQVQQMPFTNDAQFRKISPLGKIPVLIDGDLTICDSKVICEYLEAAYPEIPVFPSGLAERTKARWYEELGGTRVAELAAGIFFQRFMRPMMLKQETDEELVAKIIAKQLPPVLDYLESEVPAEDFLFGDFGVADMGLVMPFINAGYAGYEIDAGRWPKFAAFAQRVRAHEVIAPLLAAEAKMLGLSA